MKRLLILLIAITSNNSIAQESPDYLQNIENLKYGAKIASSMTNCRTFGFTVPKVDSQSFVDGFVTQAVKDGMYVQDAQSTLLDALKQEKINQDYLFNNVVNAIAKKYSTTDADISLNDFIDDKDLNE